MADPRVFDTPVGVARDEAFGKLEALLEDLPEAQETFSERYSNPDLLHHSAATLLVAARDDQLVRETHGLTIMVQALAHVLADQDHHIADQERRISELEATAAKGSTKR
jgi:hypothetical protein